MSKEVEQASNTVNGILKKQLYECASPTVEEVNKMRRRISFSGKKSIKEFASGTDVATIWGPSYEVSADNLPQIHNDSSRRDLSKDFIEMKTSKKNYVKISPENDKENIIIRTGNSEYSIELTDIVIDPCEKSYLRKHSEASTSFNSTDLNVARETQKVDAERSNNFERTINIEKYELSFLNKAKPIDVTLQDIVPTEKQSDKVTNANNIHYGLETDDFESFFQKLSNTVPIDLNGSLCNITNSNSTKSNNYNTIARNIKSIEFNTNEESPSKKFINIDSGKCNRRTVCPVVNMEIFSNSSEPAIRNIKINNNKFDSLEISPDVAKNSNSLHKNIELMQKDVLFTMKTEKERKSNYQNSNMQIDESVVSCPNNKKKINNFKDPLDISVLAHSSHDEQEQAIPKKKARVLQFKTLSSPAVNANKRNYSKIKNIKRQSILQSVKMDLDESLIISPANKKIKKKDDIKSSETNFQKVDIELDESIKQINNATNVKTDKGSEKLKISDDVADMDKVGFVNQKRTNKFTNLLEDSLQENELKMKFSNLKFIKKPKTILFNDDLSQMSNSKITPREKDLEKTDLEINKTMSTQKLKDSNLPTNSKPIEDPKLIPKIIRNPSNTKSMTNIASEDLGAKKRKTIFFENNPIGEVLVDDYDELNNRETANDQKTIVFNSSDFMFTDIHYKKEVASKKSSSLSNNRKTINFRDYNDCLDETNKNISINLGNFNNEPVNETKTGSSHDRRTIVFNNYNSTLDETNIVMGDVEDCNKAHTTGAKTTSHDRATIVFNNHNSDLDETNKVIDNNVEDCKEEHTTRTKTTSHDRRTIVFNNYTSALDETNKDIEINLEDFNNEPIIETKMSSSHGRRTIDFRNHNSDLDETNKVIDNNVEDCKEEHTTRTKTTSHDRRTIVFNNYTSALDETNKDIEINLEDFNNEHIIETKMSSSNGRRIINLSNHNSDLDETNIVIDDVEDCNKQHKTGKKTTSSHDDRRTILFDKTHEILDETNKPDQSESVRSMQTNVQPLRRSIFFDEKIQSCESSDDGNSQKSLLEFENTESTLKKTFQVRPQTPGKKNILFPKKSFNNESSGESTENSTSIAEVPMQIIENSEISSSTLSIFNTLFESSIRYELNQKNKSKDCNAQRKNVIFNLNNTTANAAVNENATNTNISTQENAIYNQQIEFDKKSYQSFDFDIDRTRSLPEPDVFRDTDSQKSYSIHVIDQNQDSIFKHDIKFKNDNSEQQVIVQHDNVEISMTKSPKKLKKIEDSTQLPISARSVLSNTAKHESFTNSPQNSSNTDESLFLNNTSQKDGLISYQQKYLHLTANTDDIDKFKLSLVSDLSESDGQSDEILESEEVKYQQHFSKDKKIDYVKKTDREHELKNVCSRCKTCRRSLISLNETDTTFVLEKVESKYATIDWSVLDKYKNQPTISDVWNNFKVKLENLSDENDYSIINEELTLSGIENVGKVMKKLLNEKLEQIKSLSISAIFPKSLSFDRLLINKYEDEEQCYPWTLNSRYMCDNYFIFRHRKVKSFKLVILKEKTREVDKDVKFKKILFENDDFLLAFQPHYDRLINREILKIIPADLADLYPTSNLLLKCLNDLNEVAVPIHELVFDLLEVLIMQDASLEYDETTDIYYIQKIHRVENESGLIDRFEFHITVDDIEQICYKDITLPSIIYFKKSIEDLPVGLEFVEKFLNDPMIFLTTRDPTISEEQ